ncbi:glycolipid transfer protein domain-containing protein [Hygrophoropsis aurantiaca]|uniref:Glycolipid transfer protein domain-containing protein n=1 Tax=Hygrophoropsis aurantiaca TaxID=72124 RepID=A0ACB8A8B3_9AGAM|nr:glycolipid transfer protein domain-containing protein [Hygrophoropsis aurantiaca]
MAPYLESVKSFADVTITDAGVNTLEFLEAATGLLGLFDLLGSAAFVVVQKDIKGNITKVRTRYDAVPDKCATLEQLVINEKGEKKRTATEGLMWLIRGLSFTCKALQNAQANPEEQKLSVAFTKGYDDSLKKFHGYLVKQLFAVAMTACPYRKDFFVKLAADPNGGEPVPDDKLAEDLKSWLAGLESIVQRIEAFYAEGKYGEGL